MKPPDRIAPEIFRQRLLVEGYFSRRVTADTIRDYLLAVAAHLGLGTYGEPIVFSPASGKEENAGFDAFVPLIDSGISAYFRTGPGFLSIVFYTCKGFDEEAAAAFTRAYFDIAGQPVTHSF